MSRRMWDENELIKIAKEHGGGAVNSVNSKTGTVVLDASDINTEDDITIDEAISGIKADITGLDTGKLDASKAAVATVGGLVIPSTTPVNEELVGIDTSGSQQRVTIGNNLSLASGVLSAAGIELVNSGEFSGEHQYILFDNPLPTYQEGRLAVYLLAIHQTENRDDDTIIGFLKTDRLHEGLSGSVFYREELDGQNCKIVFYPGADSYKLGYEVIWAEFEAAGALSTLKSQFDEQPCYLYKLIG